MQLIIVSYLCVCVRACEPVCISFFVLASMISHDEWDQFKLADTLTVCNVCESNPELTVGIQQDLLHLDFYLTTTQSLQADSRYQEVLHSFIILLASTLKMSE